MILNTKQTTTMNENIDLTKILKDCPEGWPLYSSVFGDALVGTEDQAPDSYRYWED